MKIARMSSTTSTTCLSLALIALVAGGCVVRRTAPKNAEVMDLNDTPVQPDPGPALEPLTTTTPPPAHVTPPPSEPIAPAARMHTIAAGDTLWSLAVKYYGDGKQSKKIQEANPGLVAEKMSIGKQIIIP